MKTNKKLDPHANEFSLIVVRKVEVMFYNDRSSDTASSEPTENLVKFHFAVQSGEEILTIKGFKIGIYQRI